MALLIDTDVLVDRERGRLARWLESRADPIQGISVITVSELLHGVHRASAGRRLERLAQVEGVLETFVPLPITESIARAHAEIWSGLAARGETVDQHDLWIAATALAHGAGVATINASHFRRIPGLRVVTPDADRRG